MTTKTEPVEYGPIHSETTGLSPLQIYGLVMGAIVIIVVFAITWAATKHIRRIAEDVKVIRQDIVNIPPLSFHEKWEEDMAQLIKEAQALNQTLQLTTRTINTMSLKVGALDYSMNGLDNALTSTQNQLNQVPIPKPVPRKTKVKVSAPLIAGPRFNGSNHPVP